MEIDSTVEIASGVEMPLLGLGTWQATGNEAYDAVRSALELGYRHIDTATMYRNEDQVGRALRRQRRRPRRGLRHDEAPAGSRGLRSARRSRRASTRSASSTSTSG